MTSSVDRRRIARLEAAAWSGDLDRLHALLLAVRDDAAQTAVRVALSDAIADARGDGPTDLTFGELERRCTPAQADALTAAQAAFLRFFALALFGAETQAACDRVGHLWGAHVAVHGTDHGGTA